MELSETNFTGKRTKTSLMNIYSVCLRCGFSEAQPQSVTGCGGEGGWGSSRVVCLPNTCRLTQIPSQLSPGNNPHRGNWLCVLPAADGPGPGIERRAHSWTAEEGWCYSHWIWWCRISNSGGRADHSPCRRSSPAEIKDERRTLRLLRGVCTIGWRKCVERCRKEVSSGGAKRHRKRSPEDACSEREMPAAVRRIAWNWGGGGTCALGAGKEGHEAEIASHMYYARLSGWKSGPAEGRAQRTHGTFSKNCYTTRWCCDSRGADVTAVKVKAGSLVKTTGSWFDTTTRNWDWKEYTKIKIHLDTFGKRWKCSHVINITLDRAVFIEVGYINEHQRLLWSSKTSTLIMWHVHLIYCTMWPLLCISLYWGLCGQHR